MAYHWKHNEEVILLPIRCYDGVKRWSLLVKGNDGYFYGRIPYKDKAAGLMAVKRNRLTLVFSTDKTFHEYDIGNTLHYYMNI